VGVDLLIKQQQLDNIVDPELVKPGGTPVFIRSAAELLCYLEHLSDSAIFRKRDEIEKKSVSGSDVDAVMVEKGCDRETAWMLASDRRERAFVKENWAANANWNAARVEHGSSLLMAAHKNKSSLFVDKYINCVIPDPQLEFLLESIGIMEYDADLVPGREFKYSVCQDDDGVVSELFVPNISGDRWNPYMRFKSSSVSGSQQCSKLSNLAGIDVKQWIDQDARLLDNAVVFNELVLTYPQEISLLLLDLGKRDIVISRAKKCVKLFFKGLHGLFDLPDGSFLGCSESIHTWDSHLPFLPHLHHHVIFPHFSYRKISKDARLSIDESLVALYTKIEALVSSDGGPVDDIRYDSVLNDKRVVDSDIGGCKVVTDQDFYKILKKDLSKCLSEYLGFNPLLWKGRIPKVDDKGVSRIREVPLDAADVKKLWSSIVKKEFAAELKGFDKPIDLHVQWFKASNKAKLLHALQYKTRPPVLDLDLFFRRCENFVVDYNRIDKTVALDYVRGLFVKAVMREEVAAAARYESLLKKVEFVFSNFSDDDILEWMRFISISHSKTMVLGYWRNIKRYLLDPLDRKVLVDDGICLVCGGFSVDVRYVSSFCIDSVIMRTSSKFTVYNIKGPPDPGGVH